uniref:RAB37, member RAS oncogene family n=1 Tax=Anas platyrhynchos platyrhynchos TaxID=8840 RepID=A0A493TSN2_ANAPP
MLGSFTRPGQTPRGASNAPHGVTPRSPRAPPAPLPSPPAAFCSQTTAGPPPLWGGSVQAARLPPGRAACSTNYSPISGLGAGGEPWAVLSWRFLCALGEETPPHAQRRVAVGVLPACGHPLGPTLVSHLLLCGFLPPSSTLMVLFSLSLIPRRELTPPTPPVLSSQKLPFYLKQFQETQLFIPAFRFQTHPRARACRRLLQHPPSNPRFAFYFSWREVPGLWGSAQPWLGAPSRSPPRHGGWSRSSPQQDPPRDALRELHGDGVWPIPQRLLALKALLVFARAHERGAKFLATPSEDTGRLYAGQAPGEAARRQPRSPPPVTLCPPGARGFVARGLHPAAPAPAAGLCAHRPVLSFSPTEQGGGRGWREGEAAALLLLYDITSKMSFDNIRAWLTEIHEYAQKDVVIMLLGNKADVSSERAVRTEDGASLARVSHARVCTPCDTPPAPQARALHLGTPCSCATHSARCPDLHGTGGTAGRGRDPVPKPHPAKGGDFGGAGGGLGLPPDGAVPPSQEYGVPFMETSAKTGMNVELAFLAIAKELKQRALQPPDEPRFQIHDYIEAQQKKSGCCAFA